MAKLSESWFGSQHERGIGFGMRQVCVPSLFGSALAETGKVALILPPRARDPDTHLAPENPFFPGTSVAGS